VVQCVNWPAGSAECSGCLAAEHIVHRSGPHQSRRCISPEESESLDHTRQRHPCSRLEGAEKGLQSRHC
jgi:hypothetical protein